MTFSRSWPARDECPGHSSGFGLLPSSNRIKDSTCRDIEHGLIFRLPRDFVTADKGFACGAFLKVLPFSVRSLISKSNTGAPPPDIRQRFGSKQPPHYRCRFTDRVAQGNSCWGLRLQTRFVSHLEMVKLALVDLQQRFITTSSNRCTRCCAPCFVRLRHHSSSLPQTRGAYPAGVSVVIRITAVRLTRALPGPSASAWIRAITIRGSASAIAEGPAVSEAREPDRAIAAATIGSVV